MRRLQLATRRGRHLGGTNDSLIKETHVQFGVDISSSVTLWYVVGVVALGLKMHVKEYWIPVPYVTSKRRIMLWCNVADGRG